MTLCRYQLWLLFLKTHTVGDIKLIHVSGSTWRSIMGVIFMALVMILQCSRD